jgi:uncharacterized protein (TIGR02231 family)
MKKILGLICVLFLTTYANAGNEKIVKSTIKKVTVYSQGAQIHRRSSYSISTGVTEVIIEGVSPRIDPKSLQVKATGDAIILDSKYSLFYPKPAPQAVDGLPLKVRRSISLLEDSIENINFEIQMLQDEIDVLTATKNILANNGAIRGKGKVNDSIALLKEAVEYYTVKMMEVNKRLQKLNRDKSRKVEKRRGMNGRLTELRNYQNNANLNPQPKGPIHRIIVTLKTNSSVSGKLDISYLVSNAGWTPMYDLRSEITSGKVNLNYKAQVYQNTGVDWENVRLNISTNNPYQNKTKPELHPWYVDFYRYNQYQQKNESRNKPQGVKKMAEAYGFDQAEESSVPLSNSGATIQADAIYSDQFTQVIDHVISAEFRIDLPYTIKSNSEQHMVLIKNEDLKADYKYYTVPKYDKSVYLVAQLSKLDELQLVPAKANIFFDGSYIGETYLDPTTMDDTLNLSLGKDPNIIVKRTLLKKESKDKVIGTKKERTFAYAIEVKNLKSSSIEIVVQDQIPVTQNAEIEIEATELSKGKLDERTGLVEWKFTLKPKGKKDIQFKYKVKFDKDKNVPI